MTGAGWRKSSYSGTGNDSSCVEIQGLPGVVAVRDSKDRGGPVLAVAVEDWRAFTELLKG